MYYDSGNLNTHVPDVDTGIDWLVCLAQYSQQCHVQSHFVVQSRLDIVENTEIMAGLNQAFYCDTFRPDCRPFRTGTFTQINTDIICINLCHVMYSKFESLSSFDVFMFHNI